MRLVDAHNAVQHRKAAAMGHDYEAGVGVDFVPDALPRLLVGTDITPDELRGFLRANGLPYADRVLGGENVLDVILDAVLTALLTGLLAREQPSAGGGSVPDVPDQGGPP